MIRIPRQPSPEEFARAVETCKATDAALDGIDDFDTRALVADRHARARLVELLDGLRQRRGDDCAAIMADGTIVALAHQADGLVIAPPCCTLRLDRPREEGRRNGR